MAKTRNTLEKGRVRWIVFREDDAWYGVALEFNLVVEADDKQTAMFELHEAIKGYVEAARAGKLRDMVLNQTPNVEYGLLWKILNNERVSTKKISRLSVAPNQVFSFGVVPQYA